MIFGANFRPKIEKTTFTPYIYSTFCAQKQWFLVPSRSKKRLGTKILGFLGPSRSKKRLGTKILGFLGSDFRDFWTKNEFFDIFDTTLSKIFSSRGSNKF
jgi:hypothetical protein